MTQRPRWLCVLLLALCACNGSVQSESMSTVPAPPQATPYAGKGPTSAAQLAMADLHARLRKHFDKPWDIERYDLPSAMGWDRLTAYYGDALGKGWSVDARYEDLAGPGYRSRVWTDGQRAAAVALQPGADESTQVLTVFLPEH